MASTTLNPNRSDPRLGEAQMTGILEELSTEVTDESAPLLLKRCAACGHLRAPVVSHCSACRSDLFDQVPASGFGVIVSSKAVVRTSNEGGWREMPDNVAIVATDEGPWLYSHIDGDLPAHTDRRVRVAHVARSGSNRLPVFTIRD
ncbi:conserved hypothetical protein [Rhodococcus sp. RD6.2]|uniref:Zn-ribbon domain-containing OB-fold protein n=1 Tax=Rhodococcus sp. RD6.2 TaxID=260936 RepID=UPI00063B9EEB|nr:hypothetical protein [Rhodococcus sp. RD6.2]CRK49553.1 conserved hypothetical protein [Rhodococcus sp. RD6.2]